MNGEQRLKQTPQGQAQHTLEIKVHQCVIACQHLGEFSYTCISDVVSYERDQSGWDTKESGSRGQEAAKFAFHD